MRHIRTPEEHVKGTESQTYWHSDSLHPGWGQGCLSKAPQVIQLPNQVWEPGECDLNTPAICSDLPFLNCGLSHLPIKHKTDIY